jgi:hypothetical protein
MADNFNLRQFLTENKLTKNTQLLNEAVTLDGKPVDVGSIEIEDIDTADYPDFTDAYITYAEFEDGTPLTEDELIKFEEQNYGIVGELIFDRQLYLEEGKEEGIEENLNGYHSEFGQATGTGKEDDTDYLADLAAQSNTFEEFVQGLKRILGPSESNYEGYRSTWNRLKGVNEASYKTSSNSKEAQHLKKGDIIGSGDEVVSVSAGTKTPSGKVEVTLKTKSGSTKVSTWGKTTKVGVKTKETVKENTMTKRDQYLTRLVENALGITPHEENPDHEFGTNAVTGEPLPNPNDAMVVEDEMVEEKPMPKYNSIEELMKEIEHGTNEAAHKYKMDEMKRVYEALEAKVGSLEEGENAEHIDQKKVKQMRKDIAALRKAEEKLRKEFDKKFAGKEKKEAPKKEKETVTLAENTNTMENFNLKKFLTENKLTTNSRMVSENGTYTQKEILRGNMQGFKAPNPEELKVNMMIAPNMSYGDSQEQLNQQMGRITAISGDKVTYKKGDGKLYNANVDDIIIVAS